MAYSIVQTAKAADVPGSSASITTNASSPTPLSALTAGNCAVVMLYLRGGAQAITLVTLKDQSNNTLSVTSYQVGDSGGGEGVIAIVYPNIASGITGLTATVSATPGTHLTMLVREYAGIATSSPVVGSATASNTSGTSGTDSFTSGVTGTLSSQPAAIVGFVGVGNSATNLAAGTSFGNFAYEALSLAAIEDRRVTATTAVAATFTPTSFDTFAAITLALAEATAGSSAKLLSMINNQAGF